MSRPGRWRRPAAEASSTEGKAPVVSDDIKTALSQEGLDATELQQLQPEEEVLVGINTGASDLPPARWRRSLVDIGISKQEQSEQAAGDGERSAAHVVHPSMEQQQQLTPSASFTLRSGLQIPVLGLGTRQLKPGAECRDAVRVALRCGYRLVDTAATYGNEQDVGNGIKAAGLRREDIFLIAKLRPSAHGELDDIEEALRASLRQLGTSYVDLYLIQSPRGGSILETWGAMLELKKMGLARAAGVSNFGIAQLQALIESSHEAPEVNQVEVHFGCQQRELLAYCAHVGIVTIAAAPLSRGRLLGGRTALAALAARRGRAEAELAVRWCMQRGLVAIPKSKNPQRIESNAPFGFSLSKSEMREIGGLDSSFVTCSTTKAMELPWDAMLEEVLEVSEDDGGEGMLKRRGRRRRRKGQGKGRGKGGNSSSGGKGGMGKAGGGSASSWSDMLHHLS